MAVIEKLCTIDMSAHTYSGHPQCVGLCRLQSSAGRCHSVEVIYGTAAISGEVSAIMTFSWWRDTACEHKAQHLRFKIFSHDKICHVQMYKH